ncbi:DEAD/DEAH box helicase family protein [Burkholderia multivorans]|uniref:DEAD/DEAH box helicase family protein n=1 Tax=Burkholderia multivorans TaxID=87883 RepID=UPI001C271643|nr:DEAD/DEAH box helicase family protein [Burkholderia multivorans]MBU9552834.1 DEAD/DEAH box helicase family protein [Burkholderia multivorans]
MGAELQQNPFIHFHSRYYRDPILFVQEVLGAEPDDWQKEFLTALAEGKRKISVRSGHGVGKSTTTSWAAIWHFYTRFPQKTVITAPTSAQLYDALYSELKAWMKKMPDVLRDMADIKTDRIEFIPAPEESFISLRTSRAEQPEALQGVHSENVLLIGDEASGIPEAVFEAASGSMSGHNACTILLGNPTRSSGYFYDTHNSLSGEWFTMRVSCVDSPRVSKEYVREQAIRFGEDSNAYRIRVLGEFPLSDDDTVIPMHLIESAIQRDIKETPGQRCVWGLDVARFGTDRTALCIRHGNVVRDKIQWWSGLDTMQTVGRVKALYDACTYEERPVEILVDAIGLGAGVVDRGREMGLPMRGVNVSEAPALGDKYLNLRAELWYKAREWLETRAVRLPADNQLKAELATIRYQFQSTGKIKIESKDEIKKRGVRSPDLADAFVLTFASDAATAGSAWAYNWNSKKPLRRNIPRVV